MGQIDGVLNANFGVIIIFQYTLKLEINAVIKLSRQFNIAFDVANFGNHGILISQYGQHTKIFCILNSWCINQQFKILITKLQKFYAMKIYLFKTVTFLRKKSIRCITPPLPISNSTTDTCKERDLRNQHKAYWDI